MRKILTTAFALAALAFGGEAAAYELKRCGDQNIKWNSNNVTLMASNNSFPTGTWRNGIQRAVDLTNQNPSNFRFTLVSNTGGVALSNGQNEVWGSTDTAGILQGAPAIAYTPSTCLRFAGITVSGIDETDVIFDYSSPWRWTTSTTKTNLILYGGSLRALHTTGVHEFGHSLGLSHENDEYNIMGRDFEHLYANGSTASGYLGEDAADATVALYGLRSGAFEDVALVHWRWSGRSGEYSDHDRTRLFSCSGLELPRTTIGGEPGYRVNRGQCVQLELTYENNGRAFQSGIAARYYISTNDYISTFDRQIGVGNWNLGRAQVATTRVTLTVPNDLTPARNYWIGGVLDPNNAIREFNESNNATYIPIRIN